MTRNGTFQMNNTFITSGLFYYIQYDFGRRVIKFGHAPKFTGMFSKIFLYPYPHSTTKGVY